MNWGIQAPSGVSSAWGSRAIFRSGTVDIVGDRQGGGDDDLRAACGGISRGTCRFELARRARRVVRCATDPVAVNLLLLLAVIGAVATWRGA